MADEASKSPNPFDVSSIKALVALMTRNDLSEIDLRDGDRRVRLRRGAANTTAAATPAPVLAAPHGILPAHVQPISPTPPTPTTAEASAPTKTLHEIKSPTPGTFYSAPTPGADAFVRVGSRVTPTSVVCLIEAMKIFNEINADCTGVIAEVLVENQQPVEYGQVLFRVDPSG